MTKRLPIPKSGESSSTGTTKASGFRPADRTAAIAPPVTSTGQSVLLEKHTVTLRAVRGSSVTIPFRAEHELAKQANREANRKPGSSGHTGNTDK
jgi:hypothetical protein